jgi:hypothetical protein
LDGWHTLPIIRDHAGSSTRIEKIAWVPLHRHIRSFTVGRVHRKGRIGSNGFEQTGVVVRQTIEIPLEETCFGRKRTRWSRLERRKGLEIFRAGRARIQGDGSSLERTRTHTNRFIGIVSNRVTIDAGSDGLVRVVICFAGILQIIVVLGVTIVAGSDGPVRVVIYFATISAGSDGLFRVVICFAGILRMFVFLRDTIVAGSEKLIRLARINIAGSAVIGGIDGLEIIMTGCITIEIILGCLARIRTGSETGIKGIFVVRWHKTGAGGHAGVERVTVNFWSFQEFMFKHRTAATD